MLFKRNTVLQYAQKFLLLIVILVNLSGVKLQRTSYWGSSEVKVEELSYAWKINNFTLLKDLKVYKFLSPGFPWHERRENQFRLAFFNSYPGVFENLNLFHGTNIVPSFYKIAYNIKILNNNNQKVKEWSGITQAVDSLNPIVSLTKTDYNFENEFIIVADLKIYKNEDISGGCNPPDLPLCNFTRAQ